MNGSFVVGPSEPPLLECTIGEALNQTIAKWPRGEALVSRHQAIRWDWAQFADQIDRFASGLLSLGLTTGDRVGIWAHNCAEWAVAQFATARAGIILVNINPAYRLNELEYCLKTVALKALIVVGQFKTSNYIDMVERLMPEIARCAPGQLASARFPELTVVIHMQSQRRPGWLSFEEVQSLGTSSDRQLLVEIAGSLDNRSAINIQFTSGTTGSPKGATLSHRNILNNAYFVGLGMELDHEDRLCIPVPLYHCFGMVMGNLACVVHGATMVYPSEGFQARAVLEAIEAERCTALHGVPTMFIAELEDAEFERFDLSSLRTGIMAGSPCPVEVMRRVIGRMHMSNVGIAYGMTETSPVSFQTAGDDSIDRRVSTIGRVQPHLEVKIIDGGGRIVPRNEVGELCTRGYSVMMGYWADPIRTAEVLDADGWMHTGDLATIDDEGYGRIVGRIKDMIIRGGENVYPREIEEFLFTHPKVKHVQIVGVPDPRYGEEVCACVILRTGEVATAEEIVSFCKDQIAHYKIPRYVYFVESFPMTVTGKVQKFILRDAMIKELGLQGKQ
jgi:fatty-acyl-CoA synthase